MDVGLFSIFNGVDFEFFRPYQPIIAISLRSIAVGYNSQLPSAAQHLSTVLGVNLLSSLHMRLISLPDLTSQIVPIEH